MALYFDVSKFGHFNLDALYIIYDAFASPYACLSSTRRSNSFLVSRRIPVPAHPLFFGCSVWNLHLSKYSEAVTQTPEVTEEGSKY